MRASNGKPLWTVEAPWWRIGELSDDPPFKHVSVDPAYWEKVAILTVDEAKALAAKFAPKPLDQHKGWVAQLDRKLENRDGRLGRVEVMVYEWESGYG